ncbi:hypothetical protein [Rhodospira trueperi]|uniref:Uncharacterized protein n=1 Tax=Rhodospira trueperi TaxID=69960 RepID=A0A1G6WBZ9_9PROT|nr:hypothetical protein [Rhodospira trueperi]SDD62595.1 hypothetical protein SAMN05421720_10180 [Rhodospira trueperi]
MRRAGVALVFLVLAVLAGVRLGLAVAVLPPADRAEAALVAVFEDGRPDLVHEAADAWRRALARSPADPFAWSGLAWAEAARGAPVPYVDRLMARAAVLGPHVPEIARARRHWRILRRPATPAP